MKGILIRSVYKSYIKVILFFLFGYLQSIYSQENLSSDELFTLARDKAFKKNNYPAARNICKTILQRSPSYSDVAVFLGRLYTWDDITDSAIITFDRVLEKDSTVEDAYLAYFDLMYWGDNYEKALEIASRAQEYFPHSEEVLIKKARALSLLKNYNEALITLEYILSLNNSNTNAILLFERIKDEARTNAITLTYDRDQFDKTFDPWHSASIAYTRRTPIGAVIGRLNYANRFKDDGWQFEMDAYPRFVEGMYSYLNVGYSSYSIFPKLRFGASVYYSLPYSFEIDAGIRYLKFSSSDVKIFTGALGKYFRNYWFSFRTFITPSVTSASHSYSLIIRYYLSGADDYLSLSLGTGISPDDRNNGTDLLVSRKIYGEYQMKIGRQFLLNLSSGFYREEYSSDNYRNRISFGIGLKTIF